MGTALRLVRKAIREVAPFAVKKFTTSDEYWKTRYRYGGNSGRGSRGESAAYKAGFVNAFCQDRSIADVAELGCGDGQNARLLDVERYVGLDISPDALELARKECCGKSGFDFRIADDSSLPSADLALSMDVVFHLVEDAAYSGYMRSLARIGQRYCLVYATDHDESSSAHVRHRDYSAEFETVNPDWRMTERFTNPLYGSEWRNKPHFCLFERITPSISP